MLSVAGLALAHGILHGEADAEHPEEVAIGGLHVSACLDEGLPFLYHRSMKSKNNICQIVIFVAAQKYIFSGKNFLYLN